MKRMTLVGGTLLLALVGGAAYADVDPQITSALKRVKAADYPSANSVLVISDQNVVYQPDGKFTNTTHMATLVLTDAGKKDAATASLYYAKDAEKMDVLSAQVVKRDGTVVTVSPKDIQDVEQSGEENIYDPNGRALKVTYPGLAVGDVADITYRLTRVLPTRENYFNDIFVFQNDTPMLEASYNVDGPKALPLVAQIYHPERAKVTATKQTVGDRIHYSWSTRDAVQLVPEIAMDEMTELPVLIVTTDPSWQHFSQWWAGVTAPQLEATSEIKAKVAELTKDKKTPDEKIRALYDFVAQDIRYRGLGVGPRTGYTPRKASETLSSRWGVCRDVSILLTSMLRESGFEAYPVLTNMGEPVLPKIAYDGFNHAIVAMPKQGGGWTYLDPTAKNNAELLPGMEAEQNTLVSTTKGEPLTLIPALAPSANLGHASAATTVRADGSMTSKVTFETKGMFDMILRSEAVMMSNDQQRELVEQVLHRVLPDAKLTKLDLSSPLSLATPMTVTFEIEVPNAAPKTGDYRLLRSIVTSGALGLVEAVAPRVFGADLSRKYGFDSRLTFEYDQDETIALPSGMKIVALPNAATTSNAITDVSATCTSKDASTVACHRSFSLKSRFIDTAAYKDVRSAIAALGQIARQPIILSGGPS